MKIGKIKLKNNIILAPLAGVNDKAFRQLCSKNNCALTYSPMVSINALERENKATLKLFEPFPKEKPYAVQVFGTRIKAFEKAIEIIEKTADIIDLNLGCPDTRIIKQGAGSALLRRPAKIQEIIAAMCSFSKKPITAKIRIGFTNSKNAVKIAKVVEKAGAAAITVHGRTVKQAYTGKADWNIIKEIKKELSIPVVGNGDIFSEEAAENILQQTKCDGIMIARASMGNPYIFKRISHYLEKGEKLPEQIKQQKIEQFLDYLNLCQKYKIKDFAYLRQQAMYFSKGIEGARSLRQQMNKVNSMHRLKTLFQAL